MSQTSGNTLADFQYQLNAVNNITQMIDGLGTHNFTYDKRDRLTAATHPNQTNESYTLDDVGNRTVSHQGPSYTYQAFNRLTAANSNTYAYNANGNLISKTDVSGSWTYSWDYENRLKHTSKAGGVTVTYAYDALSRRVQRTSSAGGTTKFVFDGADVLRDLDGSGATNADYLNGPGIDNKLRQTADGTVSYFASDHSGTTRALTDASGGLTSTLNYDSFGNVTSGSSPSRYTYTGREIDSDTGLIYYRARWYDPRQGRFLSEDPIGLGGGTNIFAYVENNPLRFTDPSGLCPQNPKPCDTSREAVNRAAKSVASKVIGASVGIQNGSPVINFADDYPQTLDKLKNAGYYSGILAFNPFDHRGGYEFRTYGSPGFHFKIVYPNVEETHEEGRLRVRVARRPATATDLHIDCNNPVGAGLGGTIGHGADFIRYHTPSWLPPMIFSRVLAP